MPSGSIRLSLLPLLVGAVLAAQVPKKQAITSKGMTSKDESALHDALDAYDQGLSQKAEPALRILASRYPGNYEANEALGSLYAEANDLARALPYLRHACVIAPNQPIAHANLGAVYLKLAKPADAVQELQLAVQLEPGNVHTQTSLGQAFLLTKQPGAAASAFSVAVAINPTDIDLKYNQALALYESNAFADAAKVLDTIPADSMNAETHSLAADVDEHAGEFAKALTHYEAAARSEPTDANLFAVTAELLRHWNWEEAIKVADYGAQRYPASEHFRLATGIAYYAKSDYPAAVGVFASLLQANTENALAADLLGRSCTALVDGENTGCSIVLDFAKRHTGNAVVATYAAVAILHASQADQNLNQAHTLLTSAIAADPNYSEAYLRMGVLEQIRQHWAESATALERSIALNPTAPEAHYRLSRAYAHLGRNEEARTQIALHKTYSQQAKDSLDGKLQEVMRFILNPS